MITPAISVLSAIEGLEVAALVFGVAGGSSLALATILLVVRGGPVVGPNLQLVANYFPGYTVTVWGSLLGFGYGALFGAIVGWTMAWIYNRVAAWRIGSGDPPVE